MLISSLQQSEPKVMGEVHSAILRTLMYFDLFDYPLTPDEIIRFAPIPLSSLRIVEETLQALEDDRMVFRFGEFRSLLNDYAHIERRKHGNRSALEIWDKAVKRSKFIQQFPFVRSVNISGSLSKNYFDAGADFDFFIITAPGRLWLCRTLLTLYKKICLLNSRKYFCINYFIDTNALEIPDKNIFAATEIITLKNMTGVQVYNQFMEYNKWIREFFPNYLPVNQLSPAGEKQNKIKSIVEHLLHNAVGNRLDTWCRRVIVHFWKRKYKAMAPAEFENNFRSRKHVSKHHPHGFQLKVLEGYKRRIHTFEERYGVTLFHG